MYLYKLFFVFFFQAEDGIRDLIVTGVQTCALPIFQRCERATRNGKNFFTVSGETATLGSDGSISLATAIFMGPPAAPGGRPATSVSIGLGSCPRKEDAHDRTLAFASPCFTKRA